jgi:parallel beta-helix repeat protein
MRKGIAFGIVILFIGASVVSANNIITTTNLQSLSRGWLYVGGGGPGNYTHIQDAIDNASEGDTVFVYNGTYFENVAISKTLNLIGQNRNNTIVDGSGTNGVVNVSSDWVNISGFTVHNSSINLVTSSYNTITGNTITNGEYGIMLYTSSFCSTITNNIINNNTWTSIYLWPSCDGNTIADNTITDNIYIGIYIDSSSDNTIIDNIITNSGGYAGVYLESSCSNNTIKGNTITNSGIYGCIYLGGSSNNMIVGNTIAHNGRGIMLYYSQNNTITGNTITNCDFGICLESYNSYNTITNNIITNNYDGIALTQSSLNNTITGNTITNNEYGIYVSEEEPESVSNNLIYHNNLLENNQSNACDGGTNIWYNITIQEGNYWSDYSGEDNNHDGIGDTPYNISGGDNQDLYPFMKPNGWLNQPPNRPTVDGPSNGKVGVSYNYNFFTFDPDGDNVYYYIKWGDNSSDITWIGPYPSGQVAIISHTFSQKGTFSIRCQAKDINNALSDWGTLIVTMPLSYEPPHNRLLLWLFGWFPHAFPILRHLLGY